MGVSLAKPGYELQEAFRGLLLDRHYGIKNNTTVNFSAGNPAFTPFPPIMKALAEAAVADENRFYTNTRGSYALVETLAAYCESLQISPMHEVLSNKHILPGLGVTHLYSCVTEALARGAHKKHPGKTPVILMSTPTYGLFATQPEPYGIEVETFPLREEDGWKTNPEMLDAKIREVNESGAKFVSAFYHDNPHNPTGVVETHEDTKKISQVLRAHKVLAIDDLAYLGLEYKEQTGPMAVHDFENTVTLFSLSKTYCAPGVRAGFACGPTWIIDEMDVAIKRTVQATPVPVQYALMGALAPSRDNERAAYKGDNAKGYLERYQLVQAILNGMKDSDSFCAARRADIKQAVEKMFAHRQIAEQILTNGIPDIEIVNDDVQSGYFSILKFKGFQDLYYGTQKLSNSFQLAAALVDQGKVLTLPMMAAMGEAEIPGSVRMSFGFASTCALLQGLKGIYTARQFLSEKPNPVLQDQLAARGLALDEAFA